MEKWQINLAKTSGFCFGVRRAISIVEKESKKSKEILMLNDIVHNEEVIKRLEKLGVKKIKTLKKINSPKTLLLCAHGEPKKIVKRAISLGYRIIDATCPMVKNIHRIAEEIVKRKRTLIVIGDTNHAEVIGIVGQVDSKSIIIDPKQKLNLDKIKKIKSASAVVQSTQDLETVLKIKDILHKNIADFEFFNTICKTTQLRQKEAIELARKNQLILVVGSKKSANTKRLYQISKRINKRTYLVSGVDELKKSWFDGIKTIGITAGASTPDWIVEAIIKKIKEDFS